MQGCRRVVLSYARAAHPGDGPLPLEVPLTAVADGRCEDLSGLVITDAVTDRVRARREHAFLTPAGATLPFTPRGPVFRFS